MKRIFLLFAIFIFIITGCSSTKITGKNFIKNNYDQVIVHNIKNTKGEILEIYILDVEQADAILIKYNNHNILIDSGNNDDEEKMVSYLKKANVDKLDFVIATHCDADHIGGMDSVIKNFKIDTFYMTEDKKDTKTFKDMIIALREKKVKVVLPKKNLNVDIDKANFMIIPPKKTYKDSNDNSIILKLDYNNFEMLFTGDMEKKEEEDILAENIDLDVDMLKVSHHGSNTSTSQIFLDKTTPEYAFISVGKDNDYGHPHKEVISRLNKNNIKYYRTDEMGSIIIQTDGKDINIFSKKPKNNNKIE